MDVCGPTGATSEGQLRRWLCGAAAGAQDSVPLHKVCMDSPGIQDTMPNIITSNRAGTGEEGGRERGERGERVVSVWFDW